MSHSLTPTRSSLSASSSARAAQHRSLPRRALTPSALRSGDVLTFTSGRSSRSPAPPRSGMNRSVSVDENPAEYSPSCLRVEGGPIFRRLEEEPVFRSVAVSEPDLDNNLFSSSFRSSASPYVKQDPFGGVSDKHSSPYLAHYQPQPLQQQPLQPSALSPPHSLHHQHSISPKPRPQPHAYSGAAHLDVPKVHALGDPISNNAYATSGVRVMGTSPRSQSPYQGFAQHHAQSVNDSSSPFELAPRQHAQSVPSGEVQFDTVDRLRLRVDPASVGAPPRPEYVEPCGHFSLPTKDFTLFEFVMRCARFLAKENIDFRFNESKCEFQCFAYKKVECIRFAVSIYKENDSKHLVEFRRRRGDCLKSIHMFHALRSEVLEIPKPTLPDIPPEFRDVMCLRSAMDHDSTALVPCLIDMCHATDIECSEQGVRYLALLSTKETNVEPLHAYGVLEEMLGNVHAPHSSDTRRCAATCLANLIPEQDEAYPQGVIQTLLKSECISSLANLVLTADCSEVQREGARALYGVLHALRNSRPVDFDFLTGTMSSVLDKLNACDDETTLKYHRKLLSLVGSMEF